MTPDMKVKLRQLLINHEGVKNFPYQDINGQIVIGAGRNLSARGISLVEAIGLLDDDIEYFYNKLQLTLPWFIALDMPRQVAIIDMCFNLGMNGFLEFDLFLKAMEKGHYLLASQEMMNSKWANQVPKRAAELQKIIETGEMP